MINTKELEKRWYKYKTKGMLLVASILTLLSLLIYGGYYILYKLDINIGKKEQPKAVMSIKKVKEKNSSIVSKSNVSDVLLLPTIPIIDLEKEKLKDSRAKKRTIEYNIAKKHHQPHHYTHKTKLVKAKLSTYLTPRELSTINGEKRRLNFQRTGNNYMSIMKQKFEQNKNPRDALLIAKAYYSAGNYKQSEEWSLKANSLNSNLDESWLIFAKSKDKMGKRREALKILVAYYNKSKSSRIKALINEMKAKSI